VGMENEWRLFDLNNDPIRLTLIHNHTNNPFEVHNWSFLRADPVHRKSTEDQEKFLQFLNQYHHNGKVKKPFFFIDLEHAVSFMSNFKGKKVISSFNQELAASPKTRNAQYCEILALILKERIHLEKYEFYSKDIVDAMMKKVDENFQNTPEFKGETMRVKDLIENVTKATHLKFEKPPESWEKKVNYILNCKPRSVELIKGRKEKYALCLNFLHYWLEKTGMHVQQDGKISHADTLVEIINKLIYFSNSKVMDAMPQKDPAQPS
jgi:uncharacterized protein YjgD (DUF1641 family)